jgi:hypothetical protein
MLINARNKLILYKNRIKSPEINLQLTTPEIVPVCCSCILVGTQKPEATFSLYICCYKTLFMIDHVWHAEILRT